MLHTKHTNFGPTSNIKLRDRIWGGGEDLKKLDFLTDVVKMFQPNAFHSEIQQQAREMVLNR